jgi:hypothetical protein
MHVTLTTQEADRDQEAGGLKPAQATSLRDFILKKTITKRCGAVTQGVGPEFMPQYHKNK